jgi:hypothetical protein
MNGSIVFTPYDRSDAVDLGNQRWRKMLLPIGTVNYKGRKLQFTADYLAELVRSFREQAFPQVPFQLATDDNKHTNDPERYRGELVDLEQASDGLYAIVEPTAAGQQLLETNPKLQVSARIYENYERGDGQKWTAALQHVLGTLDPHITGMGPWEKLDPAGVALSQQDGEPSRLFDLTELAFEAREEGKRMPTKKKKEEQPLTDDERAAVREVLDSLTDEDIDALASDAEEEGFDEQDLTDDELDALLVYAEAEFGEADDEEGGEDVDGEEEESGEPPDDNVEYDEEEGGDQEVGRRIAASNVHDEALELANAQLAEQSAELARVASQLDEQTFQRESQYFARELGIPPRALEFARPLLEGRGRVVELAGGDTIDAGEVMRRVLTEIGNTIKVLDLSGLVGNGEDPGDYEDEQEREAHEKDTRDFVQMVRGNYGL